MFRKIIACICIFAIGFSAIASKKSVAFADDTNNFAITQFWDWIKKNDSGLFNAWRVTSSANDSGCNASHDGNHSWKLTVGVVGLDTPSRYVCKYCGQSYSDYASGAYEQALENNGLSGIQYNSHGGLIWTPTIEDINNFTWTPSDNSFTSIALDNGIWFFVKTGYSGTISGSFSMDIVFPFTGYYICINPVVIHLTMYDKVGNLIYDSDVNFNFNVNENFETGNSVQYSNTFGSWGLGVYGNYYYPIPSFYFTPSESSFTQISQSFYNIINNINTTSMDIAVVNESNEITNVYQDTTIINNDNTQITIPGGDTYNITDYDFDFSTNTYHLHVLEDGIEIPVDLNFGIDGITINFPDKIYEYHYVTETDPEPSPTPGPVDPSPSPSIPTPTPSGRPDWWPEDYDTDDTQDWNKLFKWLEDFKTWLGKKLDQLIGKDPVIINNYEYEDTDGNKQTWDPHTLKDKFAFWTDVRDIGTELYSSVQAGGDAPELIIHLGVANSPFGFQYGGDEYALDLSWYGQYKESVDSISGGFLWLLYLYGIFKHLPEIFSGVGMMDNRVEDIESGHKARRRGK